LFPHANIPATQPKTQPPVPLQTMFVPHETPWSSLLCAQPGVPVQVIVPGLQVVPQLIPVVHETQLPAEQAVFAAVQAVPLLQQG
jgi:hypothetical protein